MAVQLAMSQPNYSRLEKSSRACIKRLPQLARALGTTPEILQTYHLVQNEAGDLEAAGWIKTLLAEKEQLIQEQSQYIQFQHRYLTYLYTVYTQCGIPLGQLLDEPPAFTVLS